MLYHPNSFYKLLWGKRKPSLQAAVCLEKITSISRLSWLYPEEFFNPQAPHLYQGPYPPNLSHLRGEALELAKKIIEAFPRQPPTWQEFKLFKRQYKKNKKGSKALLIKEAVEFKKAIHKHAVNITPKGEQV